MIRLSVCLIVKNEEPVLGRCLSCVRPFADELIVVDTGSSDRTVEIARQYTDLVFEHPWQNSFSEARNYAASLAGCEYVMWIDADNVIEPDSIERICRLKEEMSPDVDVVFMTYRGSSGVFCHYTLRDHIHRRCYAALFEGDIHEAIRIRPEWNRLNAGDIVLHDRKETVNEPGRNRVYLERAARQRGRMTDRELAYYCGELFAGGETERTVAAYRELQARRPDHFCRYHSLLFAAGAWMRTGQYEVCAREIRDALSNVVPTAYLYCRLGQCCEQLGLWEEAEASYRLAVRTPDSPETGCVQFAGYTDCFPALRLTKICIRAGRYEEAVFWNTAARSAWPEGLEWKWDAILLQGKRKTEKGTEAES